MSHTEYDVKCKLGHQATSKGPSRHFRAKFENTLNLKERLPQYLLEPQKWFTYRNFQNFTRNLMVMLHKLYLRENGQ